MSSLRPRAFRAAPAPREKAARVRSNLEVNPFGHTVRRRYRAMAGAIVGVILAGSILWNLVAPHPDPQVTAMQRRGYPTTLAGLDAWYPAVPPVENAALIYTNAFAHLTNSTGKVTNFISRPWLPFFGRPLAAPYREEVVSILAANQEALRLLQSVPAAARSRYPLDLTEGYTLGLPHLVQSRTAVFLLASQGLLQAGDGNAEAAAASFLAAGRVAESLAEEPLIVSQCVRCREWEALLQRLERAVSLARFTDGQLAALQAQVQLAERPQAVLRSWVAEWVSAEVAFHDPRMWDSAFRGSAGLLPRSRGFHVADLPPWGRAGCRTFLQVIGLQERDRVFCSNYLACRVAAMELPYPARFAALQRLASVTNSPGRAGPFSQLILTVLPRFDPHDAEHAARVRVAAVALGLERFRLAHGGALPDSLGDLRLPGLESPLLDPFDGQPLRYRRRGADYVVYSVGSDLKDDGGANWESNYLKTPSDIGFVSLRSF